MHLYYILTALTFIIYTDIRTINYTFILYSLILAQYINLYRYHCDKNLSLLIIMYWWHFNKQDYFIHRYWNNSIAINKTILFTDIRIINKLFYS